MIDDVEIVYIVNGVEYSSLEDEVDISEIPSQEEG